MTNTNFSIFISYKRGDGAWIAKALSEKFEKEKISTFLDINDIGVGKFEEKLFIEIAKKDYFCVILSENDIRSLSDSNDWVRKELDFAINSGKVIIPFFYGDVSNVSIDITLNLHYDKLSHYVYYIINIESFEESITSVINKIIKFESTKRKFSSIKENMVFLSYIALSILTSIVLWVVAGEINIINFFQYAGIGTLVGLGFSIVMLLMVSYLSGDKFARDKLDPIFLKIEKGIKYYLFFIFGSIVLGAFLGAFFSSAIVSGLFNGAMAGALVSGISGIVIFLKINPSEIGV